jgi:phospholipid/cholesterol/gamma-HCH transport system substrate-binding protein
MESKLNYTIVGLFVAILLAGSIIFLYWLSKSTGNQQYDYYHVYMTESVSGLSADASVKYLGVDVGRVTEVDINPTNSEQVALLLQIRQGIPVKVDTKASLRFYGVTGLAFIELMGGGRDSPLLAPKQVGDIPEIAESASTFSNIEKTLNDLAANSATVLQKIDLLLSDDNLNNVDDILAETKLILSDFHQFQPRIASLIEQGVVAEKSIDDAFKKISKAAEDVVTISASLVGNVQVMQEDFSNTLSEIDSASQSVKSMSDSFQHNYADSGQAITEEVSQSLTSFQQLLSEMEILVVDLQRTARTVETSPSDLFLKSHKTKLGPGEGVHGEK